MKPRAQTLSVDPSAPALVLPLTAPDTPLSVVGGKGANLAKLTRAGLPVPPGFLITTLAYHQFVAANDLQEWILAQVAATNPTDPQALETTAQAIRARFLAGEMPPALRAAIDKAYAASGMGAVAVRSSATAEDLPELSFAGQQDTYLNVVGPSSLHEAVKGCWASLWTARAIGYRARNSIDHAEVALSVVVQAMVQSEASGVLFTANPLTGNRQETVIDATLGLGEALVSGQVEPDHYVVNSQTGQILHKTMGAKAVVIRGEEGGGTRTTQQQDLAQTQALPDDAIRALTALGQHVAALYDLPQDIEWAWAGGQLALLQARPITSLFPLPLGTQTDPLDVYFSFATVQGVLDPLTPLGRDVLTLLVPGGFGRFFGIDNSLAKQRVFLSAGERLWIRITPLLRNRIGKRLVYGFAGMADAGMQQALAEILREPTWTNPGWPTKTTLQAVGRLIRQIAPHVARSLVDPEQGRRTVQQALQSKVRSFQAQVDKATMLAEQLDLLEEGLPSLVAGFLPIFIGNAIPGILLMNRLLAQANRHWAQDPTRRAQAWEITRGLPHNVTTEMDLALWQAAQTIRADEAALAHCQQTAPAELAQEYLADHLPSVAQQAVAAFLTSYGQRGVAEIDLGRTRWHEAPTQVLQMIQSYLRIEDPEQAPDLQFRRGAERAQQVLAELQATVRKAPLGTLQAALVGWMSTRFRALAGLRESPKFFFIQALGLLRTALLRSGAELVEQGVLNQADDIFYLRVAELRALLAGYEIDWRVLVAERRAIYAREQGRRQVPRVLLSDGRAFYAGVQHDDNSAPNQLLGTPVSPGIVEGKVHLVFEPHKAQLEPGEILVCPGTDPAWTPLFLAAGGLVMEVGGLMTHGSVVAREYGIPAVVGVHEATSRLRNGQRIRVNGSTGEITILD